MMMMMMMMMMNLDKSGVNCTEIRCPACEQNIQNYHAPDADGHDVIEEASETMIDVAMRINEIKRQHERWLRAQEVHNALTGDQRVDVVELGDLVLEVCVAITVIMMMMMIS